MASAQKEFKTALSDSEKRMRAILDTAVEGIITINYRGIIESVNGAAEKIFGYLARELIGKNVKVLMPEPFRGEHDRHIERYKQTGHAKVIGIGRETIARRKDGTLFPIDLAVSEVKLADRRLFTGFVRDISERKRLEREILEIGDREQRRIGQDLHDGLCQQLAGIELMSRALEKQLAGKSKLAAAQIAGHVRDAICHTRLLARGLSPVTLESQGLMAALEELSADVAKIFHVNCEFLCPAPVLVEDHPVATHLFRIAQEAVSNAIRHGKARQIIIRLARKSSGDLSLRITDNGAGFQQTPASAGGMGLHIMKSRAAMIGGTLLVGNQRAGGASVLCSIAFGEASTHNRTSRGSEKQNWSEEKGPHR